jgi:hypothetical protein
MKIKALIAALFVAGFTASIGLGATRDHGSDDGTTTTTSTSTVTTTTPKAPRCKAVALSGAATGGSAAFKATHTSKNAAKLAGTAVTLTIPAGARVAAVACTDANGVLTLRSLRVVVPPAHHHLDHGPADTHDGGKHK